MKKLIKKTCSKLNKYFVTCFSKISFLILEKLLKKAKSVEENDFLIMFGCRKALRKEKKLLKKTV